MTEVSLEANGPPRFTTGIPDPTTKDNSQRAFDMNEVRTKERLPRSIQNKQVKVGKWNDSLKTSDVNQIWTELHRIVSSHPLVRASKRAGFLVEEGKYNA